MKKRGHKETFAEAVMALAENEVAVVLSMLCDLVHATITFNGLAEKSDQRKIAALHARPEVVVGALRLYRERKAVNVQEHY